MTPETHRWVEAALGRPISRAVPMAGATSSEVTELTDAAGDRWVLRRFTNAGWLADEPDLATHEAAALETMETSPLPTPRLVAVDAGGESTGVPAVLMSRLPGSVTLPARPTDDWLGSLVDVLLALDDVAPAAFPWHYAPWHDPDAQPPVWSRDPGRWARALETIEGGPPDGAEGWLHRDFHPTNVLWREGAVSGVVDWVNACVGPRSVDVAHCARNLACMYGAAAAVDFVDRWEAATGDRHDPRWDLLALADWLEDPAVYAPWRVFGLDGVDVDDVRRRAEDWLGVAVGRLSG